MAAYFKKPIVALIALNLAVFCIEGKEFGNDVDEFSENHSASELNPDYWRNLAQSQLKANLQKEYNTNEARNVIIFLGDGMSATTLAAARAYMGQLKGRTGEESQLSFEKFPYIGMSKTYCVDMQVADSACSATAYLSGVKANLGTIGVPASVKRMECYNPFKRENPVSSIMEWAQDAKKHTGVVTTTRVTHASPAGTYAHTGFRDWEADSNVINNGQDPLKCPDIATQLVRGTTGRSHKVVLGGGRKNFLPNTTKDESGVAGARWDGMNLIDEWMDYKESHNMTARYVTDRNDLLSADPNIDSLLGLFSMDHMRFHLDANPVKQPTLSEMTRTAIQILQKCAHGFVLFVEGGLIDQAHHMAMARKALDETIELSKAVEVAMEMTDSIDTLVLVTSDHSHTMTYAGYSPRGSDILGLNGENGTDGLPYTTLSYANGPASQRRDLSNDDLKNANYTFPGMVPKRQESHGGDDVVVFASGPWAHLFSGFYEQNFIPHCAAFASCIGKGLKACNR